MSTKVKIILIATLFNLSFELALRGIAGIFVRPGFIIGLFLIYFAYYSIVEDLIRRYRITNIQLLLVAFAFGLLPETFLTGTIFIPPLTFGINIVAIIGINIIWWGFTQGLLTMYFANRLVKRDWSESPMSKSGWILSVGFLIAVFMLNFLSSKTITRGPGIGYIIVLVVFFALFFYLKFRLKSPQQNPYEFERSYFLDLLVIGSLVMFLFSGLVLAQNPTFDSGSNSVITKNAVEFVKNITRVTFAGTLIYYIVRRRQITI